VIVDAIGQRYGKRPSEILGIKNEMDAFALDVEVANKSDYIHEHGFTDTKTIKKKQAQQIAAVKELQAKVNQMKGIGNG